MEDIKCKEACISASCWIRLADTRLQAVKVLLEQALEAIANCPYVKKDSPRVENDKSNRKRDKD